MSDNKLPSSNYHAKKDEEKRKLPLIKIRFSDLLEEEPSTSSKHTKATKRQKYTVTAVPSSLRKVPKPTRFQINPSDWKDSPRSSIRKNATGAAKKNFNKKPDVPDNEIFIKPNKAATKTSDKRVRKDLFGGRTNPLRTSLSGNNGFKPRKLDIPQFKLELDNTQPLMDITEAEIQLYQKSDCFKLFNSLSLNKKVDFTEVVKLNEISKEFNTETDNALPSLEVNTECLKPPESLVLSEENNTTNSMSPTEFEFINNEKICDVKNQIIDSAIKLKSCIAKSNTNNNTHDVILRFIQLEQENFEMIEKQFKEYKECHKQNTKQLMEYLESIKENSATNNGWQVTDLNGLSVENCLVKSNKKKNVVFNLNNSTNNKQINNNIELDDKGLEKAVNFYNSLRIGCKGILTTPKLDRSGVLHTPKSLKKSQTDSISRRVQKQCLLLLDTPIRQAK